MDKTRRKFLIAYGFTNSQGATGSGRAFGFSPDLTQETIGEWETATASTNGFLRVWVTNVVELEA